MLHLALFLLWSLCLQVHGFFEHSDIQRNVAVAIYQINVITEAPSIFTRDANNTGSANNSSEPSGDICPQDDGKTYYAPDGHPYTIKCGYFSLKNQTTIDSSYQGSVVNCASHCAAYNADEDDHTTKCAGANYYPAGASDKPPIDCFLRAYVCCTSFPSSRPLHISNTNPHLHSRILCFPDLSHVICPGLDLG